MTRSLLLVAGVWGRYTRPNCWRPDLVLPNLDNAPHFNYYDRCVDETFKRLSPTPQSLLLIYLGLLGFIILYRKWRAGRSGKRKIGAARSDGRRRLPRAEVLLSQPPPRDQDG